jgi:hypothetical protein
MKVRVSSSLQYTPTVSNSSKKLKEEVFSYMTSQIKVTSFKYSNFISQM